MAEEKQKIVQELDEYIASCKNRLKNILSALDWNEEDTLKESTCSQCLPKKEKVDKNDPLLPESFDCMHSIVIGEDQLKVILKTDSVSIPEKFSDIQLNYTREQKRELYDYVIYNTGKISEPELKVSVSNESGHDMTFAEIVAKAKKKDKKLKRKYRTSKPTHIEEVRNLVHLQMQALAQYFNPSSSTLESGDQKYRDMKRYSNEDKTQRGRERERFSHLRQRTRSRSREKKDQSKSQSTHRRSRSRHQSKQERNKSTAKDYRRSYSRSPSKTTSHNKNEHRSFHAKKRKKHSRSRSKTSYKSSKPKKSKHKHRELKIKKEITENQP